MEKKNKLKKSFIEDYFKVVDEDNSTDETNKYEIYTRGITVKKSKNNFLDTVIFKLYKNEKLIYSDEKIQDHNKNCIHRCEIGAIFEVLDYLKNNFEQDISNPNNFVIIYTESEYAIKCLNDWAKNWSNVEWKNKKNANQIIQCLEISQKYNINIRLVPSDILTSKHKERYASLSENC
jgi:ribonuclease HI